MNAIVTAATMVRESSDATLVDVLIRLTHIVHDKTGVDADQHREMRDMVRTEILTRMADR